MSLRSEAGNTCEELKDNFFLNVLKRNIDVATRGSRILPNMGVVAVITVITQHINMTFRHILQNQYKSKVSRKQKHSISRENDTFKEEIKHMGCHPKLKVDPSASNWDSSSF